MTTDWIFSIPFLAGASFLGIVVLLKFVNWICRLPKTQRSTVLRNMVSLKTLRSIVESVNEGLLHHRIFKKNRLMGYMHTSLAFGWFLLIVIGHIETSLYEKAAFFPFYKSVFFRYYAIQKGVYPTQEIFTQVMDLLLLFVLSGVFLAYYKRLNHKVFGMKKTTRHGVADRIALTALWFIFPLRLFSESISAGIYNNGGFLTQTVGDLLVMILPLKAISYTSWFAYSIALGVFFVFMPFSRYMHIPTEILYIFLKNWGVKLDRNITGFTKIEANACSSCGICLDSCQLTEVGINCSQPVYMIREYRQKRLKFDTLYNCLMCGRCEVACPVLVESVTVRNSLRIVKTDKFAGAYRYNPIPAVDARDKVIYFAGCMSHLTPTIKKSVIEIFKNANIDYWFMDEEKAPCCGRPLLQSGQYQAARMVIDANRKTIIESGAKTLVVSCPICYKVFNEDYDLPGITVKHHSEFILELIERGDIEVLPMHTRMVYHDPCELGRGSKVYDQPRKVLASCGNLIDIDQQREKSLCCGGSLSNLKMTTEQRTKIRNNAMAVFAKKDPDCLVTACPLCKKTFMLSNTLPVFDLAEIVVQAMVKSVPTIKTEMGEDELEFVDDAEKVAVE